MCGILSIGPSSNHQHCGKERTLDSNLADVVVPEIRLFNIVVGGELDSNLSEDDDIDKVGVQLSPPTTVLKSSGRTPPDDAAHRWRRNIEQSFQQWTTAIKPGEQNSTYFIKF